MGVVVVRGRLSERTGWGSWSSVRDDGLGVAVVVGRWWVGGRGRPSERTGGGSSSFIREDGLGVAIIVGRRWDEGRGRPSKTTGGGRRCWTTLGWGSWSSVRDDRRGVVVVGRRQDGGSGMGVVVVRQRGRAGVRRRRWTVLGWGSWSSVVVRQRRRAGGHRRWMTLGLLWSCVSGGRCIWWYVPDSKSWLNGRRR